VKVWCEWWIGVDVSLCIVVTPCRRAWVVHHQGGAKEETIVGILFPCDDSINTTDCDNL